MSQPGNSTNDHKIHTAFGPTLGMLEPTWACLKAHEAQKTSHLSTIDTIHLTKTCSNDTHNCCADRSIYSLYLHSFTFTIHIWLVI